MERTIYFDTCALTRLTDNLSQPRVLAEADAVLELLELIASKQLRWLTSDYVASELKRNPDLLKRAQTLPLLDLSTGRIASSPTVFARAQVLASAGFGLFDALHLAASEFAQVDALLTVDDRLIRQAVRQQTVSTVQVINPVDFLHRRALWLPKSLPQP